MIARFLIDTSAAARMRVPAVADRLEPLITGGLVVACAALHAAALHSTRGPAEYQSVRSDRRDAYEYLPTDDVHGQRALEAQRSLALTGRHRAVGIADLLTAVLAAEHGATVVHHDSDFETAAEVFDFAHPRAVRRGSVAANA